MMHMLCQSSLLLGDIGSSFSFLGSRSASSMRSISSSSSLRSASLRSCHRVCVNAHRIRVESALEVRLLVVVCYQLVAGNRRERIFLHRITATLLWGHRQWLPWLASTLLLCLSTCESNASVALLSMPSIFFKVNAGAVLH